ncbi:hypothetical protein [Nocardia sp. NPDC049149]|uniref:hypothetical protein n=1 Tax=Nocardia sp. NPDC049149 TaxID=3364315 RepID=UPI00371F3A82
MPKREQHSDLREAVRAAIASWVNHPYLVLPGPTDLGPELGEHIANALTAWRPPRRRVTEPHHLMPPTPQSLPPGFIVGYIAELDDDTEGPQFMWFSEDVLDTEADGRGQLAEANAWRPGWHLYRLTDVTAPTFVDPAALAALPAGSVVLDYYGFAWQKSRHEPGNPWRRADGSPGDLHWTRDLPERILHTADITEEPDA